jgi:hypothetical protein
LQIIFYQELPVNSMNISDPQQDTVSVCHRNTISDVTFYDSANIITRIRENELNRVPYVLIEKNRAHSRAARLSLEKHLREGKELPLKPFHEDWIILLILVASFLYSSIRTFSKNFLPEVIRFFTFRSIGEPVSADMGVIFSWQATLINLISFFNLSLFIYCAASFYNFIPVGMSGILFWLIMFGVISLVITIRHFICFAAGKISGESSVFNEYMVTVYQAYRYSALILFLLVILISYAKIFTPSALFLTGIVSFSFFYLMRLIRLLLIFMKRNISVLYLILYLCALEFLPVLIAVKYFTGLF